MRNHPCNGTCVYPLPASVLTVSQRYDMHKTMGTTCLAWLARDAAAEGKER